MELRTLEPGVSVAPQIGPDDIPGLAAAGIVTIICNRPDPEVPPGLRAEDLRRAAEAAGLRFVENPVAGGGLTPDHLARQAAAIDGSAGPVLAYCASGTRSAMVWALARAGTRPADEILAATARAGYDLAGLRPQIEALAARRLA